LYQNRIIDFVERCSHIDYAIFVLVFGCGMILFNFGIEKKPIDVLFYRQTEKNKASGL